VPRPGQRLLHITDIPEDVAVAGSRVSADSVEVVFHPDGHWAVFDRAWLAEHAADSGSRRLQGCYADLDGIESAVAVAGRGDQPERTRKDRK
jgi:hypothetical protein